MGGFLSHHHAPSDVVHTKSGPIRGQTYTIPEDGRRVNMFLGIPYAQPPVGELRFKKPVPVSEWSDVRDCHKFGPRCPQIDEFFAQFINIVGKDEAHCLTLNVFAPTWTDHKEWPDGLPVMVWIHGGGFSMHSSSNYGDTSIARNLCSKDVVVVSINYRLGPFGFLSLPDGVCPGNMGLWDQTLALRWVQANIAAFGGDPGNVTIFGQSAGGASVDLLSLSPQSRDLFHRVIPMAGSGANEFAVRTPEMQHAISHEYATFLGYTGDESDSEALLNWYAGQHASHIEVGITGRKGFRSSQSRTGIIFTPVFDGDFFPRPPSVLRKEIPQKSIMTGTTEWEGLFFGPIFVSFMGMKGTMDDFKKITRRLFSEVDYGDQLETVKKDVCNFYTRDIDPKDHRKLVQQATRLMGDHAINNGICDYAHQMAECGHDVYFYSFDYCNPDGFGFFRWLLPFRAATHCTELRYVLGKGIISKFSPNDDDLRMVEIMTSYFTNFAKYGNPNGQKDSDGPWERHSGSTPFRHLSIRLDEPRMSDDYQNRRADFWSAIYEKHLNRARL